MHGGELLPVAYDDGGRPKPRRDVMDGEQGGEYKTKRRGHAYVPMISAEVRNSRERIMMLARIVRRVLGWVVVKVDLSFVAGCVL